MQQFKIGLAIEQGKIKIKMMKLDNVSFRNHFCRGKGRIAYNVYQLCDGLDFCGSSADIKVDRIVDDENTN
jgi:hypothetical protein